jgi:hypothetical protein
LPPPTCPSIRRQPASSGFAVYVTHDQAIFLLEGEEGKATCSPDVAGPSALTNSSSAENQPSHSPRDSGAKRRERTRVEPLTGLNICHAQAEWFGGCSLSRTAGSSASLPRPTSPSGRTSRRPVSSSRRSLPAQRESAASVARTAPLDDRSRDGRARADPIVHATRSVLRMRSRPTSTPGDAAR